MEIDARGLVKQLRWPLQSGEACRQAADLIEQIIDDAKDLLRGTTPPPWAVESRPNGKGQSRRISAGSGKFAIATLHGDPRPAFVNEANARLIAAAPDLARDNIAKDAIIEAQSTTIERMREAEWLPIEGAPKDGTIFDAWCACETAVQGGWRIADVVWEPRYGAFFSDDAGVLAKDVTHWRPLPEPPLATKGAVK